MNQGSESAPDKLLVVDDTKTIVQLLTMILKKEGYEVYSAASGEEALEVLKTVQVDTILLDIQMGKGINGFETCKILKADPKTKNIPVIFLTAFDDLETKVMGFEVGGADFVSKSFDKIEMITRVKNQINIFKLQSGLQRGFAYIKAILDAQKHMIAIFDSNLNLENSNAAFKNAFEPSENFSLIDRLRGYDGYVIPSTDKEFFGMLSSKQDFKTEIRGSDGVYLVELTEAEVLNEIKKIVTISNITIYEVARKQEIELLKFKEKYHNTQQKDAFQKQKKIIKDQLSHLSKDGWLFDSYYKPLDILSGDTLGSIKIGEDRYLLYIVDAMGKGLSASVTSIQSTSFINNSIEKSFKNNDFSMEATLSSFCDFIRKQLLDDELLCITFVDFDCKMERLRIANYGMPPVLIEENGIVRTIKSNNPPIMPFLASHNIDEIPTQNVSKIAIYSDGLNEAGQTNGVPYQASICEDFQESILLKQFLNKFYKKTEEADDDVTVIFLTKPDFETKLETTFLINSSINEIMDVNSKLEEALESMGVQTKEASEIMLVFTELAMNAFEHGSLNIRSHEKQRLIEDEEYEDYLLTLGEEHAQKEIEITAKLLRQKDSYLIDIDIEDDGEGFVFSDVLKIIHLDNEKKYSGRGVWMAKGMTDGVYFNEKGNKVSFFKRVHINNL